MNRIAKTAIAALLTVPALAACSSQSTPTAPVSTGNGEPTIAAQSYIVAMHLLPDNAKTICQAWSVNASSTAQMAVLTAPANLRLTFQDAEYALAMACN